MTTLIALYILIGSATGLAAAREGAARDAWDDNSLTSFLAILFWTAFWPLLFAYASFIRLSQLIQVFLYS